MIFIKNNDIYWIIYDCSCQLINLSKCVSLFVDLNQIVACYLNRSEKLLILSNETRKNKNRKEVCDWDEMLIRQTEN